MSNLALVVGVDLANGKDEGALSNLRVARHFTEQSQKMLNEQVTTADMSICNEVAAITTLAMLSVDAVHIETHFNAYINEFEVKVFDADTDYFSSRRRRFGCGISLDSANALKQLKALEDRLIDVIAEAKDVQMGGC